MYVAVEYPANIEQMRRILQDDPGNVEIRYLLAQELAARLGREHLPFHRMLAAPQALSGWVDTCAPSAAVASLYAGASACG